MDLIDQRQVSRDEGIAFAKEINAAGYFETSSLLNINLSESYEMMGRRWLVPHGSNEINVLNQKLSNMSKVSKALPWNWSKVYKWDQKRKKLLKQKNPKMESIWKELPPVELTPSEVWSDLEKIFDDEQSHYDVIFNCGDGHVIKCHKVILALRSSAFQKMFKSTYNSQSSMVNLMADGVEAIILEDSVQYPIMRELLKFCYTPLKLALTSVEEYTLLDDLNQRFNVTGLDAVIATRIKLFNNNNNNNEEEEVSMASSAAIQAEMAPGLKDFEYLTDVAFEVEGKVFKLHKSILAARSKWFGAMFTHDFKEKESKVITITTMGAKVFEKVVEYLYTGRVEQISPNICIELMIASNLLGLKRLTQLCERTIYPLLETSNVVAVCQAAEYHLAHQLVSVCVELMARDLNTVKEDPEFGNLPERVISAVTTKANEYQNELEKKKKWGEIGTEMSIILYPS